MFLDIYYSIFVDLERGGRTSPSSILVMTEAKTLLVQANLKMTHARLAVLSYLDYRKAPLTADEIYVHVNEEHDEVDKATIYRILDMFHKKGLVKRLEFSEGKYRYELAGEDHHHLICERCGKIEDISDCGIGSWENEIRQKKNFIIKRHALEFYGVCQLCQS